VFDLSNYAHFEKGIDFGKCFAEGSKRRTNKKRITRKRVS